MERIFELLVSFLGGSLVSGIVTILIQRNHKKKDEQRDLYRKLRERLCHYKDDIGNMLILFYKNVHRHCGLTGRNVDKLTKKIDEVSQQVSMLNISYKECASCEIGKSTECSYAISSMELMNEIDEKTEAIKREYKEIEQESSDFENNYWQNNEEIYNVIGRYKNLTSDLGLIKNKSILLINLIGEIDRNTLRIMPLIQKSKIESDAIIKHCNILMGQIDKALMQLDKDND